MPNEYRKYAFKEDLLHLGAIKSIHPYLSQERCKITLINIYHYHSKIMNFRAKLIFAIYDYSYCNSQY